MRRPDLLRIGSRRLLLPGAIPALLALLALLGATAAPAGETRAERRRRVEEAARVGSYPARPFTEAFEYRSKGYLVRTNTSEDVAFYIGELMDFAQKNYRRIFEYDGAIPRLTVHAYRTDGEFQRVAKEAGLPGSTGFFGRKDGESTIHVAYTDTYGEAHPTTVLLHEGTHQFVSMALFYPIPERYRRVFADDIRTLPSVPLWLNEGLATYMEVSYYDGNTLVTGEINKSRLRELQQELRTDRNVPLRVLFRTENSRAFGPAHYAAAWGVVYWFRHDADPARRRLKRRILAEYLDACRSGFLEDPVRGLEPFLTKDFNELWRRHITERGFDAFKDATVGPDGSFDKWEAVWKEWILDLDPDKPYGGLAGR